ncbi:MAG TPA: RhuM family protein [Brevundimonas sp.]|uniref:RhuM family protein n=1 Tax=Brevundimonas sp. TaxID=1871086 RepID=UPI0026073706|nr:RhuM family protein [Brevundimonas sp.]HRO33352.1 RhuM family protein [Brevundimonas sp.]
MNDDDDSITDLSGVEPVRVYEDGDTGDRFLIYSTAAGVRAELKFDGEALWMTQAQIAQMFGRDVSVVSRHIAAILQEGELEGIPDLHFLQIKGPAGRSVTAYSLDMVISVGYRVSSAQATLFRRWATAVLVRFATKGFVVDTERLKSGGEQDRIAELREIIRDIRSSEANVYAEIRQICAFCQDYDPKSERWREFYRNTQAKLCYAVTNLTPAQVIISRADAGQDNMGLQVWSGDAVKSADVTIAKNYLRPPEIKELNRLTDILLSIFEDQLEIGRLTTMAEAEILLDRQLRQLNRIPLTHGGEVSKDRADHEARRHYKLFDQRRKAAEKARVDQEYADLRKQSEALPKPSRRKPKP